MDIFLLISGGLLILSGVAGSFLPIIPGPVCSWLGLLVLHLTDSVPQNTSFLTITLAIALLIFLLDALLPVWGTKKKIDNIGGFPDRGSGNQNPTRTIVHSPVGFKETRIYTLWEKEQKIEVQGED